MAAIHGRTGDINFAGATDLDTGGAHKLLASAWSSSIDRDVFDVTPFSPTSNARARIGGLHGMTGTVSGFLDDTVGPDLSHMTSDEAPAAFVLTSVTSRTYSFNGILSNFSPSVDVQGANTWSASFESDGPITIA